jgi:glutathione S-transferase
VRLTVLTLYHNPDSRSSRFIWLLEEMGQPYDLVYVDIRRLNGSGAPDPRNPHPDKSVPALLHDDVLVTESVAIALYLTDAFPEAGLGVSAADPSRAAYLGWLAYYAGEIELVYEMLTRDWLDKDPRGRFARDHRRLLTRIETALANGPFLLRDRFTAADVLVSSPFQWTAELSAGSPAIAAWLDRLNRRPAALRAATLDKSEPGITLR